MNPEDLYLQNLRTIERIARAVARKHRLNADEAGEFTQEVCVRLLDDDYAVLRKFEDRSQLSTYLTTVILRLYQQWRVEQWGKWRPSAEARRLGEKAIVLERLITRDGFTYGEAVRVLTTPTGSQYTEAELERIYARLPLRTPRPMPVSDEVLPELPGDTGADERVEARERERAAAKAVTAMDHVIATLTAEDRLILRMRFWDSCKVPEIASALHIEQKKLYKRLDKLCSTLRRGLERAGVTRSEVAGLLDRGDQDVRIGALPEIRPLRPSHARNAGGAGGSEQGMG